MFADECFPVQRQIGPPRTVHWSTVQSTNVIASRTPPPIEHIAWQLHSSWTLKSRRSEKQSILLSGRHGLDFCHVYLTSTDDTQATIKCCVSLPQHTHHQESRSHMTDSRQRSLPELRQRLMCCCVRDIELWHMWAPAWAFYGGNPVWREGGACL